MSNQIADNNKRIAKNTLVLYIRMLITLAVGLYTSRVVLNTLGVEDYGVYNIVGGVVAMFGFLNSTMSGATQRFLTTALGEGSKKQMSLVFCSSIQIHAIISILIFVLSETIGMWFLIYKLNIPLDRYDAAIWVLQCSILSSIVMVMSVPYNAAIIAHEKMDAFAYISILEVVLKLLIVFLLMFVDFDKLKLYAILMFSTQIVVRLVYSAYCKRHFPETRYKHVIYKPILKKMSSFAGWDLYGNLCVVGKTQGLNFLLNIFFGTVLNAAAGIAGQVTGIIMQFANNVIMAVRPQIMISYAQKQYARMNYLINRSSIFIYLLILMLSSPLFVDCYFVLKLWLKIVPDYAVSLCRISLLSGLLSIINSTVSAGIHATGNIKKISFISGTCHLLVIPFVYIAFKLGVAPYWGYGISTIVMYIILILNGVILHSMLREFYLAKYLKMILQLTFITMLYLAILFFSSECIEMSFLRLVVLCMESVFIAIIFLLLILSKEEKIKMKKMISNKLSKFKQ